MKSSNELTLDLSGNEEVKAALSGYSVGDDYCIVIRGKVTSVDEQTFRGSVDDIDPEAEDSPAEEEGETPEEENNEDAESGKSSSPSKNKVSAREPVMVLLAARGKKSSKD